MDTPDTQDLAALFLGLFSIDSLDMNAGISQKEEDKYYDAFDRLEELYEEPDLKRAVASAKEILAMSPYVVDARLFLIDVDMSNLADKITACQEAVRLGWEFVGREALAYFDGEWSLGLGRRGIAPPFPLKPMTYVSRFSLGGRV